MAPIKIIRAETPCRVVMTVFRVVNERGLACVVSGYRKQYCAVAEVICSLPSHPFEVQNIALLAAKSCRLQFIARIRRSVMAA